MKYDGLKVTLSQFNLKFLFILCIRKKGRNIWFWKWVYLRDFDYNDFKESKGMYSLLRKSGVNDCVWNFIRRKRLDKDATLN